MVGQKALEKRPKVCCYVATKGTSRLATNLRLDELVTRARKITAFLLDHESGDGVAN
jgi:hypothetical protein